MASLFPSSACVGTFGFTLNWTEVLNQIWTTELPCQASLINELFWPSSLISPRFDPFGSFWLTKEFLMMMLVALKHTKTCQKHNILVISMTKPVSSLLAVDGLIFSLNHRRLESTTTSSLEHQAHLCHWRTTRCRWKLKPLEPRSPTDVDDVDDVVSFGRIWGCENGTCTSAVRNHYANPVIW